ncbi:photo-regulated tyrosinase [Russula compacta]|nr:photo-regulated tyrosinase [Russula compacta]
MSHIVIKGAQGGHTEGADAPNRLEINDLIKNHDQFSLYIQALTVLHDTPESDPASHYSISAIHGLPYQPWEGAGTVQDPESQFGGYCNHGTILFPTWHRPYVALYEQEIQKRALVIAKKYKDQKRWETAASNLRAPYWDWATKAVLPDEVVSVDPIKITTPEGEKFVPNPLIKYTFTTIPESFPSEPYAYKCWKTTLRHPDHPSSPTATTDNIALQTLLTFVFLYQSELGNVQEDLTDSTYNLLLRVHTWPAFSNHTPGDDGSASNSLEAIHDEVHGWVDGHMWDPAVAGFDPVFYLHHTNVDRLLSLWKAVHPDVWVSKGSSEKGTFTIPAYTDIDEKTGLTPFWDSPTEFWTSSETKTTKSLQYTYPEFNGLNSKNPSAVAYAIAKYIRKQYGPDRPRVTPAAAARPPTQYAASVASAPGVLAQQAQSGNVHDWTVRIQVKKFELGGSFAILIFIGDVPDDYTKWRSAPSLVGSHVSFANSVPSQCTNCSNQADAFVEGFVHLNGVIAALSEIPSYDPTHVVPYLQDKLHWRIQGPDRKPIDFKKLPSLEVNVVQTPLSQETGAIFPTLGAGQFHHAITYGKAGGARQAPA